MKDYTYAQLGMLNGIVIGGAVSILLFASTGDVLYIAGVGLGAAIGLGIGAALDRTAGKDH